MDGSKQDWVKLKSKVSSLFDEKSNLMDGQFVQKWQDGLLDILDRFIGVFDGEIDCLFWNSMVRRGRIMSGMMIPNDDPANERSYYSGWINVFFPYMNQMKRASGQFKEGTHIDPNGDASSFDENRASFDKYTLQQYVQEDSPFSYGRRDDNPLKEVIGKTSSLRVFPIGLTNAPVTLKDLSSGKEYKLKLAAGFVGVQQDKNTLEVSPKIGWFMAE